MNWEAGTVPAKSPPGFRQLAMDVLALSHVASPCEAGRPPLKLLLFPSPQAWVTRRRSKNELAGRTGGVVVTAKVNAAELITMLAGSLVKSKRSTPRLRPPFGLKPAIKVVPSPRLLSGLASNKVESATAWRAMVAADRRNSDASSAHKMEAQQAFREIIEDLYRGAGQKSIRKDQARFRRSPARRVISGPPRRKHRPRRAEHAVLAANNKPLLREQSRKSSLVL